MGGWAEAVVKYDIEILGARLDEQIGWIRLLLAAERVRTALKYNPNWASQPRVPAGNPDGGQWAGGGRTAMPATAADTPREDSELAAHRARGRGRKKYVIAGGGGRFAIDPNPDADGSSPWYEIALESQVAYYDDEITKVSHEIDIDPNLIRAIMYVETTHGYYDFIASPFGINSSILPMNINTDFWGDVWGDRSEFEIPRNNIRAGAMLLRGILRNLGPSASVAAIATLYNDLGAMIVSDYGARVQTVYNSRLWEESR